MRFETSQSTPPYLNRRLQLRMLSFVGMIALVMFLLNSLQSDPDAKQNNAANQSTAPDTAAFDVRNEERPSLKPGEFLTPPADIDLFELPVERTPEQLAEELRRDELTENPNASESERARRQTRFNKRLLAAVKDDTLGIRHDEADAFFQLLDHVQHVSPTALERAALPEVLYLNLMTEPDRYRGEPVTIAGDLWRLYEFDAGPNTLGLTTLYEAWIFTGDSGRHPYRVVSTSLPQTLTPGANLRKPVRVTGYFFKREGYPSQGGIHVAPTLIASRVTPFRPPNAMPPTDALMPYLTGVVTAVGLALLVTLLAIALGDRRTRLTARQRALNAPRPSFDGLDLPPILSVEESLGQLAEQQRQEEHRREIAATGHDAGTVATSVLYRRDPQATVPPPVSQPLASEDELHARQLAQADVLHDWASRQQTTENEAAHSPPDAAQLHREQRETDSTLNSLDPATASAAEDSVFTLAGSKTNRSTMDAADQEAVSRLKATKLAEQQAARDQLERDRLTRERELREKLQQQRMEFEQQRLERIEREREAKSHADWDAARAQAERDRERLERERRLADEQEQDPAAGERQTFDRADRLEREAAEELDEAAGPSGTDDASRPEQDLDSTNDDSRSDVGSPGWLRYSGRRSSRRDRRNRRDGR